MPLDGVKNIVLVSRHLPPRRLSITAGRTIYNPVFAVCDDTAAYENCIGAIRQRRRRQILRNSPTRPRPHPARQISRHPRHRSHRPLHPTPRRQRRCQNHTVAARLDTCRSLSIFYNTRRARKCTSPWVVEVYVCWILAPGSWRCGDLEGPEKDGYGEAVFVRCLLGGDGLFAC